MIKMEGAFPEIYLCILILLIVKIGMYETRSPGSPESDRRNNDRKVMNVNMHEL